MNSTFSAERSLSTEPHLRIDDGRLLLAARITWVIVLLLVIFTHVIVVPFYFQWVLARSQTTPFVVSGLQQLTMSAEFRATFISASRVLAAIAYLSGAVIIFYFRSNNWMAWLTSLALVLLSVLPNSTVSFLILARPEFSWIAYTLTYCGLLVILGFLFFFPDGRVVPPLLKWLFLPYIAWEFFRVTYSVWGSNFWDVINSFNWNFPLIVMNVIALIARVYRYRRSSAVQQQQTKWVGFGMATVSLFFVLDFLPAFLGEFPTLIVLVSLITHILLNLSGVVLVICLGIAITRYRLWDINIVINRSLVYGLVTVLLAIVFLVGALLLRWLFGNDQSGLAVAVSLLIAGALFNPLRKRVQHVIDRRLYRFRFDLNQVSAAQRLAEIKNPGFLTGRVLGAYQVLGVLGKGGMGEVYQGQDSQKQVAIKILPDRLVGESSFRVRFEREAKTLTQLDHPHIVKVYDWGESDGVLYIALEYVDGRDLENLLTRQGRFTFDEIRPFISQLSSALDYAHAAGFVHRDIKPSNIMLRTPHNSIATHGEIVLMDFGVAKVRDAQTALTGTGAVGTIDYMAPEQIMASREVDRRADIYALGVVILELLTGERPFKGSPGQVLFAHLHQPAPDPREITPDVPAQVAMAIRCALAKDPDERFQTAGEFAAALLSL